jgi:hypothetical protein
VNAVAKIDIPDAAACIERFGALRAPGARVAGAVMFAVVGFGLDDHPRVDPAIVEAAHEVLAQQPARERNRFFLLQYFRFNYRPHLFSIESNAS